MNGEVLLTYSRVGETLTWAGSRVQGFPGGGRLAWLDRGDVFLGTPHSVNEGIDISLLAGVVDDRNRAGYCKFES